MTRIRITEVRSVEFELVPEHYAEGSTVEEMIAVETESAKTHIEYFDMFVEDGAVTSDITVENLDEVVDKPDLVIVKNDNGTVTEVVLLADDDEKDDS